MDISKSEFYILDDDVDNFFKRYFIKYEKIINNKPVSKYTVKFQIRDIKNLNSGSKSEYSSEGEVIMSNGLTGSVIIPDEIIEKLGEYFNSYKSINRDYNRKKCGLIRLHVTGVIDANLDRLNINDCLKTLDDKPLIEVILEDIENIRGELSKELSSYYDKYFELKNAKISFRDIYLVRMHNLANREIINIYKDIGTIEAENKMVDAIQDLNILLNNFRTKTRSKRAEELINKYNIMNYKTYTNSVVPFLRDLRDLIGLEGSVVTKMDQLSNTGLI